MATENQDASQYHMSVLSSLMGDVPTVDDINRNLLFYLDPTQFAPLFAWVPASTLRGMGVVGSAYLLRGSSRSMLEREASV